VACGSSPPSSGEVDEALDQFDRLLRTRTGFADVHYMVGLLHERRGDLDRSAASLERALELNPGYAEARLALASVCERRGDFERSRALATGPAAAPRDASEPHGADALDATTQGKLANLQAALGDAYREAGELRDAIDAYRRALDRCPAFHDIRQRLGIALREAGLPSQAAAEFRRVLRASPESPSAAVQLGLTLWAMGRRDDAVVEWKRVLERDPARSDARSYLRMVGAEDEAQRTARSPVAGG
jgi:tetratricopeptide (TPR) repeat protein